MKKDIMFHTNRAKSFVEGLSLQDKMDILFGNFDDLIPRVRIKLRKKNRRYSGRYL